MKGIAGLMVVILLTFTGPLLAQQGPKGPGPGALPGTHLLMMYDPQTVTTIKGTLESVQSAGEPGHLDKRSRQVVEVVLRTDQGKVTVHLGPSWYVTEDKLPLKVGQILEVTGSKVSEAGTSFVVAKEVKSEGKSLLLRDEKGLPLWRGAGPPPPQAK